MIRNRFDDPWEQGSPEHLDNEPGDVAMHSFIPANRAIDLQITQELAAEDGFVIVEIVQPTSEEREQEEVILINQIKEIERVAA